MTRSIDWKILLVDDDEDFRQVTALVLEDAGYKVTTAGNGPTGLRRYKEICPQIVITDIRMPGMDGLQVLEQIKKEHPPTEVIVMTSFGETELATRALQLEASDFITKPVHDDVLFIALKRAQRNYLLNMQKAGGLPSGDQAAVHEQADGTDPLFLPEKLIENSMDGAMVCDENEIIIAFNSTMERILGYSKENVLHTMPLKKIFFLPEWASFKSALADEDYGGSNRLDLFETVLAGKTGDKIPVRVSAGGLKRRQKKAGLVLYFKDLREIKILCDQWVNLVDQLNIGAFTIDLNRRITSFNQSAQSLTGLNETNVIGKDCRDIFSDIPCNAKCPCHVNPDPRSGEAPVEITDQSDVKHLVTRLSAPLYGPGNRVVGCLTILQDHAAFADLINRVNYEERSLKMILDNLDIGIFTVNRGRRITFFNQAAEIISGYHRRQVLSRPSAIIFKQGDTVDDDLLEASISLGEPRTNLKSSIVTPDGEIVPIRADYIPLHNDQGRIVGGLATLQDLTLAQQFNQIISDRYTFHSMIGKEPSMQKIFQTVAVVAESDAAVLLEGATGTGKDLLAKVIHSASNRADKPLVNVNCAALPDNLLESELFGYVKGAFTGADRNKPGRFQEADGGTIFLDEIGDLPLSLQAKLLQVLESKEFYPLGSRTPVKVDVRIISASNRGLDNLVRKKLFREDLFYRLNVIPIELPLLKDRRADIPLLIRHILRKLSIARGIRTCDISKNALELLFNYDFPGNVRELHNILEHALIICGDKIITPDHLPLSMKNRIPSPGSDTPAERQPSKRTTDGEREALLRVLDIHHGNRGQAAAALGVNRTTLWRRLKRLGLTAPPSCPD